MRNHRLFRTVFLSLAAVLMGIAAQAQVIVIRIGQHAGASSLQGWTPTQSTAANSVASETPRYVQEIMSTIGLKPNFEVRAARIDNAAAVVYGGQRYILYNPTFIDNLVRQTGNKWAAVSVLAHEIGHHLDGHTVTSAGSQPQLELEADEFSGYVLHKMGASLEDAQAAMKTIASEAASSTHPGRSARLASIAAGWNRATGGPAANNNMAQVQQRSNPAPVYPERSYPQRSYPETAASRSNACVANAAILGDVRFNADPQSQYYVTGDYNLVKVQNNRVYVLGKLTRLNNPDFPYMLSDESNTQLFVQANGTIVARNGRVVGTLRNHNA